jgi:hypothetical protein
MSICMTTPRSRSSTRSRFRRRTIRPSRPASAI